MSGRILHTKIIGTAFGMPGSGYEPHRRLGVSNVRSGLGGVDVLRPWMQDQRTCPPVTLPTLWRHSADDPSVSGDPDVGMRAALSERMHFNSLGISLIPIALALGVMPAGKLLLLPIVMGIGLFFGLMNGGDDGDTLYPVSEVGTDPDVLSVENLYGRAVKGREDAKFALARMAIENPRAVGALYDLWKNGDERAGITLKSLEIATHVENALYEPHAVFALSHMMDAGNEAAHQALRVLEVTEHASAAMENQYSVFALTHIARAGNEAARLKMERLDITVHAEAARIDPFAVYALSHMADAGNQAARDAMRTLEVAGFIQEDEDNLHVIHALRILLKKGNEQTIDVLAKLAVHNREAVAVLRAAADEYPTIVSKLGSLVNDGCAYALDALSEIACMSDAAADVLHGLAAAGNGDAVHALARAAETNPYAVIALNDLPEDGPGQVKRIMGELDCTTIAVRAASCEQAMLALRLLHGCHNGMANAALLRLIEGNPRAMIGFRLPRAKRGSTAYSIIRGVTFSKEHLPEPELSESDKWDMIEVLFEFAQRGNGSAFALIVEAAKTNAWATWLLDRLKRVDPRARDVMEKLDVSAYAKPAETAPSVIEALQFLAYEDNQAAKDLMRNLNVEALVPIVVRSEDSLLFNALSALVRMGNEDARQVLIKSAKRNHMARSHLKSLS